MDWKETERKCKDCGKLFTTYTRSICNTCGKKREITQLRNSISISKEYVEHIDVKDKDFYPTLVDTLFEEIELAILENKELPKMVIKNKEMSGNWYHIIAEDTDFDSDYSFNDFVFSDSEKNAKDTARTIGRCNLRFIQCKEIETPTSTNIIYDPAFILNYLKENFNYEPYFRGEV